MSSATEPTVAELFASYRKAILNCFLVPNEVLPKSHHNHTTGYVSLSRLNKRVNKANKVSEFAKEKAEKLKRIANYRSQVGKLTDEDIRNDKPFELEYDVDEAKLYARQLQWGKFLITE